MNILAIETSAMAASVAVAVDNKVIGEFFLNNKKTHSQTVMPMISNLFDALKMDISQINYIACSSGPGSFTGLKIGVSIAKGIAHALNLPIIGVATLDALAYNIFDMEKLIVPMMDARRNQVYSAIYEWKNNKLLRLTDYLNEDVEDILRKCLEFNREIIFLGDGAQSYKELLLGERVHFAPTNLNYQRASAVAALAMSSKNISNFYDFVPFYLRKPQAERELELKGNVKNAKNNTDAT